MESESKLGILHSLLLADRQEGLPSELLHFAHSLWGVEVQCVDYMLLGADEDVLSGAALGDVVKSKVALILVEDLGGIGAQGAEDALSGFIPHPPDAEISK